MSLVFVTDASASLVTRLNGAPLSRVSAGLTPQNLHLERAVRLRSNREASHRYGEKGVLFDVPRGFARQWLVLPSNPNGKPSQAVLKLYVNATDITRRPADIWIVDFCERMSGVGTASYEALFIHLEEHVRPVR